MDDILKILEQMQKKISALDGKAITPDQASFSMQPPLSKRLSPDKEGADLRSSMEEMQGGKETEIEEVTQEEEDALELYADDVINNIWDKI